MASAPHRCLAATMLGALLSCARAPVPGPAPDATRADASPAADVTASDAPLDDDRGPRLDVLVDAVDTPFDAPALDASLDADFDDTPSIDTSTVDAPSIDAPAVDAPAVDAPRVDAPALDAPIVDAPVVDAGAVDASRRDAAVDAPAPVDVGPVVVADRPEERCRIGAPPVFASPGRYLLTGTLRSAANDHRASCGENNAGEVGFDFALASSSRVTWRARSTDLLPYAPAVYVTSSCAEDARGFLDEVACDAGGGTGVATASVDLPAGTYFLVVEATRSPLSFGATFEVALDIAPREDSPRYRVDRVAPMACATVPMTRSALGPGDDVGSGSTSLGFDFRFFGVSTTRLAFFTNGVFVLASGATSLPAPASTWRNHAVAFTGLPRGVVAPLWDDLTLDGAADTGVFYWTDGPVGARVAHVAWRNVAFASEPATRISFEARLFQATDVIEFAYCGEGATTARSRGGSATVGLESVDQLDGAPVGLNLVGAVAPESGYRFTPR